MAAHAVGEILVGLIELLGDLVLHGFESIGDTAAGVLKRKHGRSATAHHYDGVSIRDPNPVDPHAEPAELRVRFPKRRLRSRALTVEQPRSRIPLRLADNPNEFDLS